MHLMIFSKRKQERTKKKRRNKTCLGSSAETTLKRVVCIVKHITQARRTIGCKECVDPDCEGPIHIINHKEEK